MLPGLEIASVGRQKKIAFMHISSLIEELEDAIASGSPEKRLKSLWRVVDLFEDGAGRYSDEQVALFDDVIGKLAAEIETKARARLARRLAPVDNAPTKVIRDAGDRRRRQARHPTPAFPQAGGDRVCDRAHAARQREPAARRSRQ